jgi:aminopeptidase N
MTTREKLARGSIARDDIRTSDTGVSSPLQGHRMMRSILAALLLSIPATSEPTVLPDGYPRQSVDVEHYRFALTLSDSSDSIAGVATVRMRLLAAGLRTVALDLSNATPARAGKGMQVSAVLVAGKPLAFAHAADRLVMTLDRPSEAGQLVEFEVHYAGIPATGLLIKSTNDGDRTFFSDDWPDKAKNWLPVIDHIADKATMEMDVTAPAHYQVVSNGLRIEETDLPGSLRRTVWRESVPIAPWVYVLGVARFAVQHVADYRGIPLETWVFAKDRDAGFHDFAVPVKDALAFYSEWIGPYSYEKLANIQSNSVSGGMEAASAILYSEGSVTGTRSVRWRNVVIHEIAHQWFGDAVTESDWNDVWLSEGFATYFTLLFIEHAYGRDEFATGLAASRKTVVDFTAKNPVYRVVHENLTDMAQVTSSMTYQKGAWTLHMLRKRLGDDRFWAGIRDYYARHRDGNASTADFRDAMERASGETLSAFFDQWLYRGGIPVIEGTWRWDAAAKQVRITLRQTQPGAPFQFPLDVGLQFSGAALRIERVSVTGTTAEFSVAAEEAPTSVTLDPNMRLLFDGQLTRSAAGR